MVKGMKIFLVISVFLFFGPNLVLAQNGKSSIAVPDDVEILLLTESEQQTQLMKEILVELKNVKQELEEVKADFTKATKDTSDIMFVGGKMWSKNIVNMSASFIIIDDLEDNYLFMIGYLYPPKEEANQEDLPDNTASISYREFHIQGSANWLPIRWNNFDSVKDYYKLGLDFGVGFFFDWQAGLRIKNHAIGLGIDIEIPDPVVDLEDGLGVQIMMVGTVSHAVVVTGCRGTIDYSACFLTGGARF